MSQVQDEPIHFEGEEADAGYAPPVLDLVAAGFLVLLSVVVMIASVRLPMPGGLRTAPGLLPFLTALSLMAMAVFLALTALNRHRAGVTAGPADRRDRGEDMRALMLAIAIAVYIACLQFLAFTYGFSLGGAYFNLSAFEPATIIALCVIIHLFWNGPLWITAAIAVGWTLILSVVFQLVFVIPLPGGF